MRNVINRMSNSLVQEVDSNEENDSLVEDPPTGAGPCSAPHEAASKSLASNSPKVTFARQVQVVPITPEVDLQVWGYTATSTATDTALSDSSLPNLKSIHSDVTVAVSKETSGCKMVGFPHTLSKGCLLLSRR